MRGRGSGSLLSALGPDRFAHKWETSCWLQPSRSEEERDKNMLAQARCRRTLEQLGGIRGQDERVAELHAELTIIVTQLKDLEVMIGAAARRLRQVTV